MLVYRMVTILYEPVDGILCDKLMIVQNLSAGEGQDVTAREIAEPIVDNKFHHRGGDLVVNLYCAVDDGRKPNPGASILCHILLGIPEGFCTSCTTIRQGQGN